MQSLEYAQLLLRKAGQDEFVLKLLMLNPDSPDEAIGFHAQQAVEKMLKAVLGLKGVHYRRTHDLVELIDLMKESGIAFPEHLDEIRRLNPFAVEFRYDELPEDAGEKPLDRSWAVNCVTRTRQWAECIMRQQEHREE